MVAGFAWGSVGLIRFVVLVLILLAAQGLRRLRSWAPWLAAALGLLALWQVWGYWRIRDIQDWLPHYRVWMELGAGEALGLLGAAALGFEALRAGGAAGVMASDAPAPVGSVESRALVVAAAAAWGLVAAVILSGRKPGVAGVAVLFPMAVAARFVVADRLTRVDAGLATAAGVLGVEECLLLAFAPVPYAPLGLYLILSLRGRVVIAAAVGGTYALVRAGATVRVELRAPLRDRTQAVVAALAVSMTVPLLVALGRLVMR